MSPFHASPSRIGLLLVRLTLNASYFPHITGVRYTFYLRRIYRLQAKYKVNI